MSRGSFAIVNFYTRGYNYYFRPFYESAKRHFFPNNPRTFFIFTDNPYIEEDDIVTIPIDEGAPRLQHWHLKRIKDRFREFDHIVLFNGNAFFLQTIDPVAHPEDSAFLAPLVGSTTGLAHQAYHAVSSDPDCVAYIDRDRADISTYWRGCLWGGTPNHVIPMIECLSEKCRIGYPRDEALINWYFVKHKALASCLDHRYVWSGLWGNNPHFDLRIVMADKMGAYGALKSTSTQAEKLEAYAKRLNVDGPFYVGPGIWKSDVVEIGTEPPSLLLMPPKQPWTRRCRLAARSVVQQLLPPFVYRMIQLLRHGQTRVEN